MNRFKSHFRLLLASEEGASAVEYGLMAGLVATVVIAMVGLHDSGFASLFAAFAGFR
ncbi:MAG: Flp family type IVb pilin [Nevskia sp.]|nr:Flp family type IVb pilin [Nevskia sp.]